MVLCKKQPPIFVRKKKKRCGEQLLPYQLYVNHTFLQPYFQRKLILLIPDPFMFLCYKTRLIFSFPLLVEDSGLMCLQKRSLANSKQMFLKPEVISNKCLQTTFGETDMSMSRKSIVKQYIFIQIVEMNFQDRIPFKTRTIGNQKIIQFSTDVFVRKSRLRVKNGSKNIKIQELELKFSGGWVLGKR